MKPSNPGRRALAGPARPALLQERARAASLFFGHATGLRGWCAGLLLLCAWLCLPPSAQAAINKCKGADGSVTYMDGPCPGGNAPARVIDATSADTAKIDVDGTTVALVVPSGYCKVARGSLAGQTFYATQERVQQGQNRVLLIYVDCEELNRINARKMPTALHFGMFMVPLSNGKLIKAPAEMTRARVIDDLAKALPALDMQKIQADAQATAKAVGAPVNNINIGTLGRDANAVYLGVGGDQAGGGGRFRGVAFMTLLKDVVVTNNLYEPAAAGGTPFEKLLAAQKSNAATLVRAN
jgi:hypothetical protein